MTSEVPLGVWVQRVRGRQPVGALEELLVETLATIPWRKRRLLMTEVAEIHMNTEFLDWDQKSARLEKANILIAEINTVPPLCGLIQKLDEPGVSDFCVTLLLQLQEQIEKEGFQPETDVPILRQIYSERYKTQLRVDLYDSYAMYLLMSRIPEEGRVRNGHKKLPKQFILDDIKRQINYLKGMTC